MDDGIRLRETLALSSSAQRVGFTDALDLRIEFCRKGVILSALIRF